MAGEAGEAGLSSDPEQLSRLWGNLKRPPTKMAILLDHVSRLLPVPLKWSALYSHYPLVLDFIELFTGNLNKCQ